MISMTKNIIERSYSELVSIKSFRERFEYLKLNGKVGEPTFGGHRYLNQFLYRSPEWRPIRREVILRDNGFDLAHPDHEIPGNIYVHHLNPITIDDILRGRSKVFDLENLVSSSFSTHNAIHYGDANLLPEDTIVVRRKNDTCPWR